MHLYLLCVVFGLLCLTKLYRSQIIEWNYGALGPDVWKDFFPTCGGSSQSPINIKTACTAFKSFEPFQFSSTYDLTQDFTLTNNGHTIAAVQTNKSTFPMELTGGGLSGTFTFDNFHLHWGQNYKSGSEHQVNGDKYAGEIHFVHRNLATQEVAVLGVFMASNESTEISEESSDHSRRRRKRELRDTQNTTLAEWSDYFAQVGSLQKQNDTTVISLKLTTLMGNHLDDFWRYSGSLTTPLCTEGVIWTIFKTPINFTDNEIADLRTNLYFEDYRDPQPLNDRVVYRNFVNDTPSTISDYNCCGKNSSSISARTASGNSFIFFVSFTTFISYFLIFFH